MAASIDTLQDLQERMILYKSIADFFYPPERAFLEKLNEYKDLPIFETWDLAESTHNLLELKKDFARLFIGPFSPLAPPYGSFYLEPSSSTYAKSTAEVMDYYREEGLSLKLKELPDHIAIELEFMSLLIHKELEASSKKNVSEAQSYQKKQQNFLKNHLGVWGPKMMTKITQNSQTSFYKGLAELTKPFLENQK